MSAPVQYWLRAHVRCDVCGHVETFELPDHKATRANIRLAARESGWTWYWSGHTKNYFVRCPEHARYDSSLRAYVPKRKKKP